MFVCQCVFVGVSGKGMGGGGEGEEGHAHVRVESVNMCGYAVCVDIMHLCTYFTVYLCVSMHACTCIPTDMVSYVLFSVICNLEGSGHWPENIDAIRALKSLYLIDLGEKLTRLNFQVDVQETHVDILQVRYQVFEHSVNGTAVISMT